MLSQCANTSCCKPFLRLSQGKLFVVETNRISTTAEPSSIGTNPTQMLVEHYWLCNECAATWTLVFDRERGISLVPLRKRTDTAAKIAAGSGVA